MTGIYTILYRLSWHMDTDTFKGIINKLAEDTDEQPSIKTESTDTEHLLG